MKTYRGLRTQSGYSVTVETVDRVGQHRDRPLALRHDLLRDAPAFEWGHGGPGSAQLALAILADCLGDDETANSCHQSFKWRVISGLDPSSGWTLTSDEVRAAVQEIRAERWVPRVA
jgi:hypothetical protein